MIPFTNVEKSLAVGFSFYRGKASEDGDDIGRFMMMEEECAACLRYVREPESFPENYHRQMTKNSAELLICLSADLADAGFQFAAMEAEIASGFLQNGL